MDSSSPMSDTRVWLRLRFAAWLAVAVHLLAGVAMATVLRLGLDTTSDLPIRLRFLVESTPLWIGGWLTWNLAALSILYFYLAFAAAHATEKDAPITPLAFAAVLSIVGMAADLAAEAIEMGVLPGLARQALDAMARGVDQSTAAAAFFAFHRTAVVMTGYLANGLYTLSAIVLAWSTRRSYPQWVWMAGLGVGLSGLALSCASLANSVEGMFWSNVALVPCIVLWQLGVALTASHRAHLPLDDQSASDPALKMKKRF